MFQKLANAALKPAWQVDKNKTSNDAKQNAGYCAGDSSRARQPPPRAGHTSISQGVTQKVTLLG
jgi:hypothetical protein